MSTQKDQLERQNRKLSILYDIALTVGKSLELKEVLDDVLEKVLAFMRARSGVIYTIDYETLDMVPVTYRNLSEELVTDLTENKVKLGECMCGSIAQFDREVVILRNASADHRFTRKSAREEGMDFYAGLPIKAKGKVVGVLCVISHSPYDLDEDLLEVLRAATLPIGLAIENALLFETARKEANNLKHEGFVGIVASSRKMLDVLDLVRKIINVPSSILICGESGTGKELIARAIHFNSLRKGMPFLAINCAALPENLLESEMFGYVKGAFTGAGTNKKGLIEAADGGTLFLDELEAMSTALQVKLLRFLQDRTFYKLGDTRPVSVDVRIIAATNRDLQEEVRAGRFREDLYYRLNVIRVDLPALRDRREDIPPLIKYFISKFNKKFCRSVKRVSREALRAAMDHEWPGNVRELENSIERAVVMAETEELRSSDLPVEIAEANASGPDLSIDRAEREHILKVLNIAGGNRKKAALLLNLDTTTLWRKLKKYSNS